MEIFIKLDTTHGEVVLPISRISSIESDAIGASVFTTNGVKYCVKNRQPSEILEEINKAQGIGACSPKVDKIERKSGEVGDMKFIELKLEGKNTLHRFWKALSRYYPRNGKELTYFYTINDFLTDFPTTNDAHCLRNVGTSAVAHLYAAFKKLGIEWK